MFVRFKKHICNCNLKKKEKVFTIKDGTKIKYFFKKCKNSYNLIVVFSGFAGENVPGKYNYIRSLKDCNINQLFILDNFGYNSVGSYYLGEKCNIYNNHGIEEMVNYFILQCGIKKTIFSGTSKGGTASLFYGFKMNIDYIICGSPQYRITDYLSLNQYHQKILSRIIDGDNEIEKKWLNGLIKNAMQNTKVKRVELLYSSIEESYEREIKDMILDMHNQEIHVVTTDAKFKKHSDVGKYFIPFLQKAVENVINE